jgi:hypothetical protein
MKYFLLILTLSLSISCMGFVHDEEIVHPYYLIAVDVSEQMSVSFKFVDGNAQRRIPRTVFSVGHDKKYITAKVHPDNNRKITHFYFLNISNGIVNGPFNENEYQKQKAELELPEFTRTFKNLE